jgi:hypothetical protein
MSKQFKNNNTIKQRFSTWGSGAAHRRYAKINFLKHSKVAHMGIIFDLEVRKGDTTMIWGYAEGYNFDLLCKCQKVENPCNKVITTLNILVEMFAKDYFLRNLRTLQKLD